MDHIRYTFHHSFAVHHIIGHLHWVRIQNYPLFNHNKPCECVWQHLGSANTYLPCKASRGGLSRLNAVWVTMADNMDYAHANEHHDRPLDDLFASWGARLYVSNFPFPIYICLFIVIGPYHHSYHMRESRILSHIYTTWDWLMPSSVASGYIHLIRWGIVHLVKRSLLRFRHYAIRQMNSYCADKAFFHNGHRAMTFMYVITHAPVHINDFRGVRARYVKRTG